MLACSFALASCGSAKAPETAHTGSIGSGPPVITVTGPSRRILAFGDSLLAGYGLHGGESYPVKLEAALRTRGINARIVNAGISGETTQQGLARLSSVLDAQPTKPELLIISLGANDMLQGRPPAQTRANLERMLQLSRARDVRVLLLGMLAAPDLSASYTRNFNPIYPSLAHRYGAVLVPFFLQPAQGNPDLLQTDRGHFTALGIDAIVSATVDDVAEALPLHTPPM